MRRIARAELARDISRFFETMPGYQRSCLRRFGNGEFTAGQIAEQLAARLDSDGAMVVVEDMPRPDPTIEPCLPLELDGCDR